MSKFIGKIVMKNHDYKDFKDSKVRNIYGIIASCIGIFFNILLSLSKIITGTIFKSISVIADGFNNLSDTASSGISLLGFKISNKPADKKHPFGHARMEYLCALIISFIIFALGIELIISSVKKIISGGESEFSWIMIGVLIASIIVKIGLFFYYRITAKNIESLSLKGVATDCFNDVITTTAIIISAFISKYTKVNLDGYVGIAIALFILFQGIQLMKSTLSPLLGEKPNSEIVNEIASKIQSYDGILAIHDLVIHNYGPNKYFASVHAEVDANVDVMVSHELIDTIEREISNDNMHLVIHMDPIVTDDEETKSLKEMVLSVLNKIDSDLTMHDFRVIIGPNRKNLIFDVVIPHDKDYNADSLTSLIESYIKEIDMSCITVINIDENYVEL